MSNIENSNEQYKEIAMNKSRVAYIVLSVVLACSVFWWIAGRKEAPQYYTHQGKVFGTYYSIQYQATADLDTAIQAAFKAFDNSLSMFNPESVISHINQNRDTLTDAYFEQMWAEAERVSRESHGAFDITVAPLVNLWGFGFKNKEQVTAEKVDSLLPLVGFGKVVLREHRVQKADPRIMLDASAVAKGQSCDVIAVLLAQHGCENYLVDIGGEVVAKGVNKQGKPWRIGITKPVDDPTGQSKDMEEVIATTDLCMATSGNYRNFYYEGQQRRSHTIDPRTGYPVQHNLLSATVVASSCMRADALATACMVLGEDEALRLINTNEDAECFLIVAAGDSTRVLTSVGWNLTK